MIERMDLTGLAALRAREAAPDCADNVAGKVGAWDDPSQMVRCADGAYRPALTAAEMPEAVEALRQAGKIYDDNWRPVELVKMKEQPR